MAVLDQNWVGWTRREFLAKVEMYELELWVESVSLSLIWNSMQQRSATARRPAGLSKDLFEPSSTLTSSWTFLLHTYVRTYNNSVYVCIPTFVYVLVHTNVPFQEFFLRIQLSCPPYGNQPVKPHTTELIPLIWNVCTICTYVRTYIQRTENIMCLVIWIWSVVSELLLC